MDEREEGLVEVIEVDQERGARAGTILLCKWQVGRYPLREVIKLFVLCSVYATASVFRAHSNQTFYR